MNLPKGCLCAALIVVLLLTACSGIRNNSISKMNLDAVQSYFIKNVNIISMRPGDSAIRNTSAYIRGNKIVSVGGTAPAGVRVIDARNKWLIPGLIDMHVHNLADINFGQNYPTKGASIFSDNQDFMLLYVANGVTTIFDLNARAENFGQRNEIVKGKVIGPRMALAFLIDGGNAGSAANSPEAGRQTVRLAQAQGYEFIKVYSGLSIDTYQAIIDEAVKLKMKVIGHIPNAFRGRLEEAFIPGFGMVAHAEEFSKHSQTFSDEDARRFARLSKANNTWLSPTLTTMDWIAKQTHSLEPVRNLPTLKYVHPLMQSKWLYSNNYNNETDLKRKARIDSMVAFHQRLVRIFKQEGVPIVAGTDAGVSALVWGYSLHDELEQLVKAGLSPLEALQSATQRPAEWLGIGDKVGTIEEGKLADLVLLDANPLEDIRNTRKITGACFNGRWVSAKFIQSKLENLAKRNERGLADERNDWKKRREW